jgi:hypothetical protein
MIWKNHFLDFRPPYFPLCRGGNPCEICKFQAFSELSKKAFHKTKITILKNIQIIPTKTPTKYFIPAMSRSSYLRGKFHEKLVIFNENSIFIF